MDTHSTRTTVKRIEKIPSKYYVQMPKVNNNTNTYSDTNTNTKTEAEIKTELLTLLYANYKQLSNALSHLPPLLVSFSQSAATWLKKQAVQCKTGFKRAFSGTKGYLIENAKHLAFSSALSASVVAAAAIILFSTCSIGYRITINNQVIGTVRNASEYAVLLEEINRELDYVSDNDFAPDGEPSFSTCLIAKGAYTPAADLKEKLKATSTKMVPAYGVYVNDEIIFALANEQAALSVLTDYRNRFLEGKENITADFCQPVTVSRRFVPKSALKTEESAILALKKGRFEMHQLEQGQTLSQVAASYGITVDDLLKNNVIDNPENPAPGVIKIPTGKPLLAVQTTEFKTLEEAVPFNTIEKDDASQYQGNVIIEQEGAEGVRMIEAYITSVNGVETKREIVSENVISAATDRVIRKGTKTPPSPIGTGTLALPASGSLSSRFGSRWGRSHEGVDVAASEGTNIYAADNGTVTYSEYNNGGYGYMIQIDHGNGIQTYYAHCSELLVPKGAVVAKGDLIAKVGNTGRSTGPHLHFEVRVNGSPVDPTLYINAIS